MWHEADLENWAKHYRKSKEYEKLINDYIRTQREKALYLQEFGRIPEEFPQDSEGHLEWVYPRTKESKEYVKKLTEANPTHSAKRPSRSKKEVTPPKGKWIPPKH